MKSIAAMIGDDQTELGENVRRSLQAVWPKLDGRADAVAHAESSEATGKWSPTILFLDPDFLRSAMRSSIRYRRWLIVPYADELRIVSVADILYVRADNKYTTIVTSSSTFLLNLSLKEIQRKLDPEVFWRIHRGTIVNVGAIEAVYRSFRGSMEIRLKARQELLTVSARRAHLFRHC